MPGTSNILYCSKVGVTEGGASCPLNNHFFGTFSSLGNCSYYFNRWPSGTEWFKNWTTMGGLYCSKQRLGLELPLLSLLFTLPNANRSPKSFYKLAITHTTCFTLRTENSVSRSHFLQISFLEKGNSEAVVDLQACLITNMKTNDQ